MGVIGSPFDLNIVNRLFGEWKYSASHQHPVYSIMYLSSHSLKMD